MPIVIGNEHLQVYIEEKGAELFDLMDKKTGKRILWNGDPAFWARRAPILFPIVGRLMNDHYTVDGRTFQLNQHGFARDSAFKVIENDSDSASFLLEASDKTFGRYPFDFDLSIGYELKGRSLAIKSLVGNKGNRTMPFSIGFHPGFKCPMAESEKFEDYAIFFETQEKCDRLFLENGLISGSENFSSTEGVLPLSEKLFERDALILEGLKSRSARLGRIDGKGPQIEVSFPGLPYLGIWKKKDAPFVCIEPWQGLPGFKDDETDFFNKPGIVLLEAKGSFSAGMTISLANCNL